MPDGQITCFASSPDRRNFPLGPQIETAIEPNRPVPTKGRFAIVTDVRRDAVDAGGVSDEDARVADGEVVWS